MIFRGGLFFSKFTTGVPRDHLMPFGPVRIVSGSRERKDHLKQMYRNKYASPWNQRKVSLLEQKEEVEPDILKQVSAILKVPVGTIENFDGEQAINIISNTFHDFKDNVIASAMNYQCTFNPIDKVMELFERLLASEKEKVELMKEILGKMK